MSKHQVITCCWRCGFQVEQFLTLSQEERLANKLENGKLTCPRCLQEYEIISEVFIVSGQTRWKNSVKLFRCDNGHITAISAIGGNTKLLHIRYGNNKFYNIEGSIDDLQNIIDAGDICCYHNNEFGEECIMTLRPIDDVQLEYPELHAIKTKTRIGDLWDRSGIEPVRNGTYDGNYEYNESKSQKANRERLKNIRTIRNIEADKLPKTVSINKPTDRIYKKK